MISDSSQSRLLLDEGIDLLSNTIIDGTFYGIAFALYCLCMRVLYLQLQDPDKRRQARFTLGYTSFVLFCATVYLMLDLRMSQLFYIYNAAFPGGPIGYEASYKPTPKKYLAAASFFDMILEIMTMAIQIWRLWVIWSGTQYAIVVIILPFLLFFSYIGLEILTNVVGSLIPSDQLGFSHTSGLNMVTANYAIMSSFTLFVTGMVTARLLLVRRRHVRLMGTSDSLNPYVNIITMLIESYALDSAWSIASAISYRLRSPSFLLFIYNDSTIKVVAYFLVVYQVASGRGWTRGTERKLTTLRWNHGAQTATNEASGTHSHMLETMIMVDDSPVVSHSEVTA